MNEEMNNTGGQEKAGASIGIIVIVLVIVAFGIWYFTRGNDAVVNEQPEVMADEPNIAGHWMSPAPENMGGMYGVRDFTITDDTWSLVMTAYGDPAGTVKLFDFRAEGPYTIGEMATTTGTSTADLYNAVFEFDTKQLTLYSTDPAVVNGFGFSACNLKVGSTTDVSATGCSFIPSVAACGQEYDLVAVTDEGLRLGARPADNNMCTEDKRPTALGPVLEKEM